MQTDIVLLTTEETLQTHITFIPTVQLGTMVNQTTKLKCVSALPCLCRDDPLICAAQTPGLHPGVGCGPRRHHYGGPRAEDAGEEVEGHRGAIADGEGLHQRPADVRQGDRPAAATQTGEE